MNHHSTKRALHPCRGLSTDFLFAGIGSKNSDRREDFKGAKCETTWILITDHFTGMMHGDTCILKAAPVSWLKHFTAQCNPPCCDKCAHMDQGGKLFNDPEVKNLFTKSGHTIHPTGADSSHQNGPVERGHCTVADTMHAFSTGANLSQKFWPCAFHHSLWARNAIPTRHSNLRSPITLAIGKQEDLTNLCTFGCRVWA